MMSSLVLSLVTIAFLSRQTLGQESTFPATPLASKHFASPTNLPEQVDTDKNLVRGTQSGYNICNSTTQNQNSLCQTSYLNSIEDFCLWSAPVPNSQVFDVEGEMVAWCTLPGHGTRVIPAGALTGVQFMRTTDYLQVVGFIKQEMINLIDGQPGGEMDPHGADLRGNPMGGIVFSTGWSNNTKYTQVIEWHNFMGSNQFCFKVCDPSRPNAAHFCEHRYDRIGCEYNAPNNAQDGVFEACDGDVQDFPGTYTSNGKVMTYTQPPESLGPISTMPYTARTPASSNCTPFQSASIYAAAASVLPLNPSASTSTSTSASASVSTTPSTSGSALPITSANPTTSVSTSSSAAKPSSSNAAETVAISGAASLLGVIFAALFFS